MELPPLSTSYFDSMKQPSMPLIPSELIGKNMGVENHLDGGLYCFKSKFNPMIEEFVGEFNLPTSILYPLVNKAYQLRKKLRNKQ